MLETVKDIIKNAPCISFEEYFQQYVMKFQDSSIEREAATFLLRNQFSSANSIMKIINKEVDVV